MSFNLFGVCGKITELSSELTDERNTGESASQLLEAETAERLRLDKDLKELQVKLPEPKQNLVWVHSLCSSTVSVVVEIIVVLLFAQLKLRILLNMCCSLKTLDLV